MRNKKVVFEIILLALCVSVLVGIVYVNRAVYKEMWVRPKLDSAVAAYYRGKSLADSGQYDLAAAFLRKAVQLNPNFGKAWLMLAWVYDKQGQGSSKETEESLLKAISLLASDPENLARAQCSLGMLYRDLKAYDQAIQQLNAAIVAFPFLAGEKNEGEPHAVLAEIFVRQGRYNDAVREGLLSVKINPKNSCGLFFLALAHLFKGEMNLAANVIAQLTTVEPEKASELKTIMDSPNREKLLREKYAVW